MKNQSNSSDIFDEFKESVKIFLNFEEYSTQSNIKIKLAEKIDSLWDEVKKESFYVVTEDFINWFSDTVTNNGKELKKYMFDVFFSEESKLWLNSAKYLKETDLAKKESYGKKIATILDEIVADSSDPSTKKYDRIHINSFDENLSNGALVKNIHLSGDKKLQEIFFARIPKMSDRYFDEKTIPLDLELQRKEADKYIENSLQKHPEKTLKEVEEGITKIQRKYRGKRREEEFTELFKKTLPTQEYDDKPYIPQLCSEKLSNEIVRISKEIKLYDEITHQTNASYLREVLEGFRGRKSMVRDYHPFRKAALSGFDCRRGDADVICFSASEIDPRCMKDNTVELILDLNKIFESPHHLENPCMFFKQRDLGFFVERRREVKIGDITISFDHTTGNESGNGSGRKTDSYENEIIFEKNGTKLFARVPEFSLISHNNKEMNSILTMNFFRFLESTANNTHNSKEYANEYIKEIYSNLQKMDKATLKETLSEIGKKASDTMEFNFYGHFLADPSLIKKVNFYQKAGEKSFSLDVEELVNSLEKGERKYFDEAKENIPELFKSYRFLEYLESKKITPELKEELKSLIEESNIPNWRKKVLYKNENGNEGNQRD